MNLDNYWRGVMEVQAEIEKQFPDPQGIIYICSLGDPTRGLVAGKVCETTVRLGSGKWGVAAKNIFDKTHRLATEAEIQLFHEESARRSAECRAMTSHANGRGGQPTSFVYAKKVEALGEA